MNLENAAIRGAVFAAAVMILGTLMGLTAEASGAAETPDPEQVVRELEEYAWTIWDPHSVPGFAYAVVKDGEMVYARGFGDRSQEDSSGPVDAHTLFEIGSCTKAFNAAALGTVVDEGGVAWSDRVRKHLPEFKKIRP